MFLAARSLYKTLRISHALVWQVPAGRSADTNRGALVIIGILTGAFLIASLIGDVRHDSALDRIGADRGGAPDPRRRLDPRLVVASPRRPCPVVGVPPRRRVGGPGDRVAPHRDRLLDRGEVESKSDTYGAIGTAVALLLWAYLLGRLVVGSAALNASLWRRQESRSVPSSSHRVDTVDTTNRG